MDHIEAQRVIVGARDRMYVQRLKVTEGFLDGLDIEFVRGLNVIIGARGTGKTSVIELIRYCLQAPSFTEDAAERGLSQALSVLQGGRVEVTLATGAGNVTIARDAGSDQPTGTAGFTCTVLAQNEIEAVGAQPGGRLHLVDRFRSERSALDRSLYTLRTEVASLTAQLGDLVNEGTRLSDQVLSLAGTSEALDAARAEQQAILETVEASTQEREDLKRLQSVGSALSVRASLFARTSDSLSALSRELQSVLQHAAHSVERWPDEGGAVDLLAVVRVTALAAETSIEAASSHIAQALNQLADLGAQNSQAEAALSLDTRALRQQLETLQIGASAVTRKVAELQERAGQLSAMDGLLNERRQAFLAMQMRRNERYAAMEQLREQAFKERLEVAASLTTALSPAVQVDVTRSAALEQYASAIAAALRGSGLHYNTLAPLLARTMSPLELVTAVEGSSASAICDATGVPPDRAAALITALRDQGLAQIASSQVEDVVTLGLLDGSEYKDSGRLSIGQRCTVVLPLLLSQHGDPLLVDQPEDHLDNAFIASTLVPSLRARTDEDQFIFASHNANIPVLGEADRVIVMDSDGQRGFVVHQGQLDDSETRDHVTSLMEGGLDAFDKRAAFYRRPGSAGA